MSQLTYRPDIDGLRAIAVIPVVLFHFGFAWLPGGFVGVDVFFVISGFLITSIIAKELDAGTFSILRFYERRIRRIFPALLFVMIVVLIAGYLLFTPADLNATAKSAFAVGIFASNFLFWSETGYFDASAYAKPLLHTWSLAIEEQFYVVLPLAMMAIAAFAKSARKWLVLFITTLTVLSFLLSAFFTTRWPEAAYYLIPFRAWELGVGAILALNVVPVIKRGTVRKAAGLIGLGMILGSALVIDKSMAFPGWIAAFPVLGAALILHAGRNGDHWVSDLLATRPFVFVGKLSYSMYLWHWPIIVIYVYWAFDLPNLMGALGLIGVTFVISWISWRFVEQPFRKPISQSSVWPTLGTGTAAMAFVMGAGAYLAMNDGLPNRLSPEAARIAAFDTNRMGTYRDCFTAKMNDQTWLEPCTFGVDSEDVPTRVALWSDSHGPSYLPGIANAALASGERVKLYGHDGCPGVPQIEVYWIGNNHSCSTFLTETYDAILNDPEIELVIFIFRSPIYTQGWVDYGFAERDRSPLLIGSPEAPLSQDTDRFSFFMENLEKTIRAFEAAGKTVALTYPLPEAGMEVPATLLRSHIRGSGPTDIILERRLFDQRSGDIIAELDAIAARTDMIPIRAHEQFCGPERCNLTFDGYPVFTDSNHMSPPVAERLAPLFEAVFAEFQALSSNGNPGG